MDHRVVALLLFSLALSACAATPAPTVGTAVDSNAVPRLLVRLDLGSSGYPGFPAGHVTDYLTDGTVIRKQDGVLERNRLTEAGLATVVATLAAADDLLATPLRIEPRETILPVDNTRDMPSLWSEPLNTFVLERADGSRYTVNAPSRPRVAGAAPDPTIEGLTALADALRDPATLVGSGGLAGPWQTYQPDRIAVFLTLQTLNDPVFVTDGVTPQVSPTDWPFEGTPDTFGTVFDGPGDFVTDRCALLPGADASTAIASLSKFGGNFSEGRAASLMDAGFTWFSDPLLWVDGNTATSVFLRAQALMPEDGSIRCLDALSY